MTYVLAIVFAVVLILVYCLFLGAISKREPMMRDEMKERFKKLPEPIK